MGAPGALAPAGNLQRQAVQSRGTSQVYLQIILPALPALIWVYSRPSQEAHGGRFAQI